MRIFLSVITALFLLSCNAQESTSSGKHADVDHVQAKALMNENPSLQIIDVRTDGEVARGMIEGAKQMDFSSGDFEKMLNTLDKSQPVLVYCAAGGRSKSAQEQMAEMGFKEVYNLLGGYGDWPKE